MTIERWWPDLSAKTQQWLLANNGGEVPASVVAEIAAAGGPSVSDPWWSEEEGFAGRWVPDDATDWIEKTADGEG